MEPIVIISLVKLCVEYLLIPRNILLTFLLPAAVYFINSRYVWFSILLTVLIEVIINWGNFTYYESQGLMLVFTAVQVLVMAVFIVLLKRLGGRRS